MEPDIHSIRKAGISRRGGVRVRGGRLPPVLLRNTLPSSNNKKAFVPNIPQRRVKVKQEIPDLDVQPRPRELSNDTQNSRGRGRGRGTKVYLQTEGSFLGQGPALKIKKEPLDSQYEKAAYSKYSAKSSSKVKAGDIKIESSKISELLEDYNVKQEFLDDQNLKKPVWLPFIKPTLKVKIKKEIVETEDIKPIIKKEFPDENEDKWSSLEGKFFTRIKKEEDESSGLPEDFQLLQERRLLILIQLPTCLPFEKTSKPINQEKSSVPSGKNLEEESSRETAGACFNDVAEGCVGKLQIMKSGRMQIVMGSVIMALENGTNSETTWEVASIPITGKDEGDLIIVGHVGRKMVLHPVLSKMMVENQIISDSNDEVDK